MKTGWRQVLKDPGLLIRNGYCPGSFLNVLQKLVTGWISVVTERMNWGESNCYERRELGGRLFPVNMLHIFPHFLEVAIFKNLVLLFPAIACTSTHTHKPILKTQLRSITFNLLFWKFFPVNIFMVIFCVISKKFASFFFYWLLSIPLYGCTKWCSYSPVDRHLGCFHSCNVAATILWIISIDFCLFFYRQQDQFCHHFNGEKFGLGNRNTPR